MLGRVRFYEFSNMVEFSKPFSDCESQLVFKLSCTLLWYSIVRLHCRDTERFIVTVRGLGFFFHCQAFGL